MKITYNGIECDVPQWAIETAYNNGYAKGVKEFAERLRKVASRGFWETRDYVEVDKIDDLEYEMVGEK